MPDLDLPQVRATICGDCPWRRDARRGWLGPQSAADWIIAVHSDEPIACHLTIQENESWAGVQQCRGAAVYRGNVAKLPRDPQVAVCDPDEETVFATPAEFMDYHDTSEGPDTRGT